MFDHRLSKEGNALVLRTDSRKQFYGFGKRLIDIVLVLLGTPLVLPVILALVVMVRLDGGPAFYLQPRVGKNGRIFKLWKFRSMVPDAEKALETYLASDPAARAEWDVNQKLRHDPRLTSIGAFIRRYSLDELPQLWNVLLGDMSLVGPRPMLPSQRPLYPGTAYYDLRPGITGLWQISERNACTFAERATYDNRYAKSISVVTDLVILIRTVSVVFRGTGC